MSRAERFYRRLLALLPAHYREEAAAEMVEVFLEAHAEAVRRGGILTSLRFWSATVLDVLWTAASVRRPRARAFRPGRGLAFDARVALRQIRLRPGSSLVVVATLGLGTAANTIVFSFFRTLLTKPLPVERIDRVVSAFAVQGDDPFQISPVDYLSWREDARSFSSLGIARSQSFNFAVNGEPRRLQGAAVSPGYLEALGVAPSVGRLFTFEDVRGNAASIALLSYGLWREAFGGEDVLGREIVLAGRAHAVVGVLPQGFDLPFATSVWVPLSTDGLTDDERLARDYFVAARLRDGVSVEQAEDELRAIATGLEIAHPRTHLGWSVRVLPLRQLLLDDFDGRLEPALAAVGAAVFFLLLIACANVGNLSSLPLRGRRAELVRRAGRPRPPARSRAAPPPG